MFCDTYKMAKSHQSGDREIHGNFVEVANQTRHQLLEEHKTVSHQAGTFPGMWRHKCAEALDTVEVVLTARPALVAPGTGGSAGTLEHPDPLVCVGMER